MASAVCKVETPSNFQEETAGQRVRTATQQHAEEGTPGLARSGSPGWGGLSGRTQQQEESWREVNNGPRRLCRELGLGATEPGRGHQVRRKEQSQECREVHFTSPNLLENTDYLF